MNAANDITAWIDGLSEEDFRDAFRIADDCFTSGVEEPENVLQSLQDNSEIPEGIAAHLVAYGESKDWESLSLSEFRAFVRWEKPNPDF